MALLSWQPPRLRLVRRSAGLLPALRGWRSLKSCDWAGGGCGQGGGRARPLSPAALLPPGRCYPPAARTSLGPPDAVGPFRGERDLPRGVLRRRRDPGGRAPPRPESSPGRRRWRRRRRCPRGCAVSRLRPRPAPGGRGWSPLPARVARGH